MHLLRQMLCILALAGTAIAQTTEKNISFSDLESLARQNSPEIKNIQYDFQLQANERTAELAFSNPEVEIEQERLKQHSLVETERQLVLTKSFAMPWSYLKKRQRWKSEIESAEYLKQDRITAMLHEIKTGYVTLELQTRQLERLEETHRAIQTLYATANSQHREGAISGLDQQLIKTALFNLNTTLVEMRSEHKRLDNHWKSLIGIGSETSIKLGSVVRFMEVSPQLSADPESYMENNPARLALQKANLAREKAVGVARANLIPEFHLAAGYKKTSSNFEGAVLGLSIPIPLLNQNKSEIEKQKILSAKQQTVQDAFEIQLSRTVTTLPQIIRDYEGLLKAAEDPYHNQDKLLQQIIISYREGWLSLSGMLNALQVYTDGINLYTNQLINYYESIFRLEAISGKQFVSF